MSRSFRLLSLSVAIVLATIGVVRGTASREGVIPLCEPAQRADCQLIVKNRTSCPVFVYMNDRLVGVCESFRTVSIRTHQVGRVRLVGHSLCDTWGPVSRTLSPQHAALWKITESDRQSRH